MNIAQQWMRDYTKRPIWLRRVQASRGLRRAGSIKALSDAQLISCLRLISVEKSRGRDYRSPAVGRPLPQLDHGEGRPQNDNNPQSPEME